MSALSKQYAPVKKIENFAFLGDHDDPIEGIFEAHSNNFKGKLNMRNNNEINISFVSLNKAFMKVKKIKMKIYDPNTEKFEDEIV